MTSKAGSSLGLGIFLITDTQHLSSAKSVVDRIHKKFQGNPTPNWGLDHRILISKAESPADKSPTRYQHVLHLRHVPSKVFIAIETPPDNPKAKSDTCIVTLSDSQKDAYNTLLAAKFSLLWTSKAVLGISNGASYRINDVFVRVGDVKLAGTNQSAKAVLVAIELPFEPEISGAVSTEEQIFLREEIKRVWKVIGVDGAKEVWGFGDETVAARTWCEALRLR